MEVIEKEEKKYMRIKTASRVYDIHPRKLQEWCIRGRIPGARKLPFGKEWWIPVKGLDAMMQGKTGD